MSKNNFSVSLLLATSSIQLGSWQYCCELLWLCCLCGCAFLRKMAILSASHLACIEAVLIVCVLLIADVL